MQQKQRAELLASLHVKGHPLALYNAWDAGSAKAIQDGGSPVIATSSWAVAAAQRGYTSRYRGIQRNSGSGTRPLAWTAY